MKHAQALLRSAQSFVAGAGGVQQDETSIPPYTPQPYVPPEVLPEYNNYGFTTLHNFRELSQSTIGLHHAPYIKPCMLYRSATLDHASDGEIHRLVHDINVNTIIDLRSEVEVQAAKDSGRAFVSFPCVIVQHMKKRDLVKKDLIDKAGVKSKVTQEPENKTILINFAGRRYRQHAVIYVASWGTLAKLVELMTSDQKPQAVTLVGREIISPKGLIGLYKDFIDFCYREIGEALKYFADFRNYPILVHCTQGKDRTGLVIALALWIVGVPEEQIIYDYSLTTAGLAPVKELMISEMARDGLDPSFSDSPPEVLRDTFAYIKLKYGSIPEYLDKAKFTKVYREALCKILKFQ